VYEDLSRINTRAPVVELSSKTGQGITVWLDWVQQQRCGAIDAERSSNQRRPGS
jgi:Ni2+-binding GTPase involved in maturation of urease and hydrogenase